MSTTERPRIRVVRSFVLQVVVVAVLGCAMPALAHTQWGGYGASSGPDGLQGHEHGDWMHGGDGNDFFDGKADVDAILGDNDSDYGVGGSGNDKYCDGCGGSDIVCEQENEMRRGSLCGLGGNDRIPVPEGTTTLSGEGGEDWINGGGGDDALKGGGDNDKIHGSTGDDWLYADDGDADNVQGGDGSGDICLVDFSKDTWTSCTAY